MTRFRDRIGVERLERIMNTMVNELFKGKLIIGKTVVLDATFVKGYSKRDSHENSRGGSDPDARVDRNGKTYELGYKLHITVDTKSELPLAVIAAPANDNEKKRSSALLEKALKTTKRQTKFLIADSQYSCRSLRNQAYGSDDRVVIPFPSNQQRGQKGLLRVDRYFRTHGPADEKRVYRFRSSVERVNSRLKDQLCLERHRAKGLNRIAVHSLFCLIAILLNAVTALTLHIADKANSSNMLQ
jgi:hypothetical protein